MRKSGWLLCLKYEPCTKPEYIYKLKGKDIHVLVQHVVQKNDTIQKKQTTLNRPEFFFSFVRFEFTLRDSKFT